MSFNRFLNTHLFRKSEENLTITTASLIYTFFLTLPKAVPYSGGHPDSNWTFYGLNDIVRRSVLFAAEGPNYEF